MHKKNEKKKVITDREMMKKTTEPSPLGDVYANIMRSLQGRYPTGVVLFSRVRDRFTVKQKEKQAWKL